MSERPVVFEVVPKGTNPSRCRGAGCDRDDIYWIERRSTAKKYAKVPDHQRPTVRVPVDCAVPGGQEPDSLTDGRGVSHFTTCVAADEF